VDARAVLAHFHASIHRLQNLSPAGHVTPLMMHACRWLTPYHTLSRSDEAGSR
jgi:hypothetical protein